MASNVDYRNFRFGEGWLNKDPETLPDIFSSEYDVKKLSSSERNIYLESVGSFQGMYSSSESAVRRHKRLIISFDREEHVKFIEDRLNTDESYNGQKDSYYDVDFQIVKRKRKTNNGYKNRDQLLIRNPNLIYYFFHELPSLNKKEENAYLKTLISSAILNNTLDHDNIISQHEKVIFKTTNPIVRKNAAFFFDINKLPFLENNRDIYQNSIEKQEWSFWFYNPSILKQYIHPEFEFIKDSLETAKIFTGDEVLASQGILQRAFRIKYAKANDRMREPITIELLTELDRTKRRLKKLRADRVEIENMRGILSTEYLENKKEYDSKLETIKKKQDRYENKLDELWEEIYPGTKRKKSTNGKIYDYSYGRRQWNHIKHQ